MLLTIQQGDYQIETDNIDSVEWVDDSELTVAIGEDEYTCEEEDYAAIFALIFNEKYFTIDDYSINPKQIANIERDEDTDEYHITLKNGQEFDFDGDAVEGSGLLDWQATQMAMAEAE